MAITKLLFLSKTSVSDSVAPKKNILIIYGSIKTIIGHYKFEIVCQRGNLFFAGEVNNSNFITLEKISSVGSEFASHV